MPITQLKMLRNVKAGLISKGEKVRCQIWPQVAFRAALIGHVRTLALHPRRNAASLFALEKNEHV